MPLFFGPVITQLQRKHRLRHPVTWAKGQIGLKNGASYDYNFALTSNEPDIKIEQKFKRTDTNFNLVATGGLQALTIIRELIDWPNVQVSDETPTPKLFILDYSKQTVENWNFIKKFFLHTPSIDVFIPFVTNSDLYIQYAPKLFDRNEIYPLEMCKHLTGCMYALVDGKNADQFKLLRNVALSATIIVDDWRSAPHDVLAKHLEGRPNYVYSSNIIDCMQYFDSPEYSAQESMADNAKFTKNICRYNPILSIYARTLIADFKKDAHRIHPGTHLYIAGANSNEHWKKLCDASLAPLTIPNYEKFKQSLAEEVANKEAQASRTKHKPRRR